MFSSQDRLNKAYKEAKQITFNIPDRSDMTNYSRER
jgi:hypothetical protein